MTTAPIAASADRAPAALSDLSEPERLIAWAFRHWVTGHVRDDTGHWAIVLRELERLCGRKDGREAAAALAAFVRALCCNARRTIFHHAPCCPCLGRDEYCVVALIAACQRRAWPEASGLAAALVSADGVGDAVAAAARLGALLDRWGQTLPRRRAFAVDRAGFGRATASGSRTLH